MRHGKPDRIDTFNGNYGLNRGLAGATLILSFVAAVEGDWTIAASLIVISGVYVYRAYRFGVHYARELYTQFLILSDEPGKPAKAKRGVAKKELAALDA